MNRARDELPPGATLISDGCESLGRCFKCIWSTARASLSVSPVVGASRGARTACGAPSRLAGGDRRVDDVTEDAGTLTGAPKPRARRVLT